MSNCFDLLHTQQKMREIDSPKKLFEAWEYLSYAYLRRELSRNELDEVKAVVFRQFRRIDEGPEPATERRDATQVHISESL